MEILARSTNKRTQKCFDFQAAISEKDRISQLPDHILHHILSFLPTTDILETFAVSTRWQSLSTSFTFFDLHFNSEKSKEENPTTYFDKFCQTELPERVRKCDLEFEGPVDDVSVTLWVDNLLKHMLEKLHLHIHSQRTFGIPDNLSNSDSLVSLKLQMNFCKLIVPDSICFPRLKNLYLGGLKFRKDQSFQRLLSGCPVLEDLALRGCHWSDNRNITISIPSLQKLNLSGYFIDEVFVLNLPSLTDAQFYSSNCYSKPPTALSALAGLLGIKSLTLSDEVLKVISSAEDLPAHLPTFHNLAHLKLFGVRLNCVKGVLVCILQKSPNLLSLEIYQAFAPKSCNQEDEEDQKPYKVPQSFQCSIKNVRIARFDGTEDEIDFLKYMLENSIHLAKMSLSWPVNTEMQEDLSKQLRQLSRGSANCVIEFFRY